MDNLEADPFKAKFELFSRYLADSGSELVLGMRCNLPIKAGIIVKESNKELHKAKMTLRAIVRTNSPVLPGSSTIGIKARIVVRVEASKGIVK